MNAVDAVRLALGGTAASTPADPEDLKVAQAGVLQRDTIVTRTV
jgi:hypothetical protein